MKQQIITVLSIKGGTGKTATAGALLNAGAKAGRKVLGIDLDPQASLTYVLAGDPRQAGAYDLLTSAADIDKAIQKTPGGIDLISGSANLSGLKSGQGSALRLEKAIEPLKKKYDLVIIDTAPAMNEGLNNALFASTGALIPLEASSLSLQALFQTIDIINTVQAKKPGLKITGTLITQFDSRSNFSRFMRDQIIQASKEARVTFLGTVRKGIAVEEAQGMQQSIFDYSPRSKPAKDYEEIYNKLCL